MKNARRVSANPLWRRLQHAWQRLRGHERYKSNAVSFLEVSGRRYKQVRFPSVSEARRVEGILRATHGSGLFPTLVHRLESTLWVRFVSGCDLDAGNPGHREALYRFFAGLYGQQPRQVAVADTGIRDRLWVHIETLEEVGTLDAGRAQRLKQLATDLEPATVWLGLEYIDSLGKNFILADSGVVGIDIEAAWEEQLLGIGLAKTRLRWLDEAAAPILARLIELGAPDLREQYPYAHLVFLAQYGVQSLFRGKPGRVPVSAYDALLAEHEG
ncbi:MAG: hypothetical protein JJT88_15070 [Gammaproteobacteria bacterium]|nr:hypothetical protein [Gammaproteobacteria bacterium]